MGKISKHGGPSIRVFQTPAQVLQQRGKLGPYGGEAKVETFATVQDDDDVAAVDPELVAEAAAAGTGEPSTADIRAWARDQGYEVASSGKISQEIVDAYHEAHLT
jgi:hypothetical protein